MPVTHKTTPSLKRSDQLSRDLRKPDHAALSAAVSEISQKGNQDTIGFWVSIQSELMRYGLERSFKVADILHEAYERGIKAINDGKKIPSPFAWLRLTCRNIIKEKQRYCVRNSQFDDDDELLYLDAGANDLAPSEAEIKQARLRAKRAFELLPPLEREIIDLQLFQKKSWQDVQRALIKTGWGEYSLPALRKRKERAVKQMKKHFQNLV